MGRGSADGSYPSVWNIENCYMVVVGVEEEKVSWLLGE